MTHPVTVIGVMLSDIEEAKEEGHIEALRIQKVEL